MVGFGFIFSLNDRESKFGQSDFAFLFSKICLQLFPHFCLITLLVSASFVDCQAQTPKSLNPNLLARRITPRFDAATNQNRFDITSGLTFDDVVSTPLLNDSTVNDTFIRTERQQGSLTFIYNTYNQNYIDNVVSGRAIDSLDIDESVSSQIAAYEGSLLLSKTLAASPVANIFAKFSEDLRAVRDALMFRVGPGADGELGFEPKRKYGKTPTFLELRLTPNTRDGIAPRLRMGENISLSHDFSRSATFLEFNINF